MRLLKIGRDVSCNIVLHSDKVSSLHAELTLLNSGDITIEDKGSRNGTFVMNQPIKPGKPVNVRRGDQIRFADVELQWSQVPMPEDNSAYQGIYGIGSHFNNDYQISGATVSRYHATVKHGRDGKFYIVDHSKNGTTVDGVKINSNTPYRIKKSSAIVCGGVPVDLSNLPWPADLWKNIVGIAASIVIIVGVVFGVYELISRKTPLQALQNSTVTLFATYYIEANFKDNPFVGTKGWPEKFYFSYDQEGNLLVDVAIDKIPPIAIQGTAFFISGNGELGTSRHIVCPWEDLTNSERGEIRQLMEVFVHNFVQGNYSAAAYNQDIQTKLTRLLKSEVEISGSHSYMGVLFSGNNFSTIADLSSCQMIAESGDPLKDVALIRLNSRQTPRDIVEAGFYDIEEARIDETGLVPQEEELTIIGFPTQYGTGANIIGGGKEYLPTVHRTYVSKAPDSNMFQLQSNVVGGQSGSPIIDENHKLVGVVFGSHRGTDVAYGCNIKHLKELYDRNKTRK